MEKLFQSFVIGFLLGSILVLAFFYDNYQQGQIDALTGKIKYELVVNQDSTRTWERIKK